METTTSRAATAPTPSRAGSGNDIFHEDGASGSGGLPDEPDDIVGGEGSGDMVGYGNRSQSLKINIDDAANDGATDVSFTEGDNVHTDVEQVIGGAGNDDIQGSAGANVLSGSGGNDILRGVDGNDTLNGRRRQRRLPGRRTTTTS